MRCIYRSYALSRRVPTAQNSSHGYPRECVFARPVSQSSTWSVADRAPRRPVERRRGVEARARDYLHRGQFYGLFARVRQVLLAPMNDRGRMFISSPPP